MTRQFRTTAFTGALLLALIPSAGSAQDGVPPGWNSAWAFLVQSVCVDVRDRPLPGVSPLDGPGACPRQRKPVVGERLPYHKRDWAGLADRARLPDGYQESDSFPVRTAFGLAVVQTYDFGDPPRRFGQFDDGDGGQVAFFSGATASFGITEDGGGGLQFFLGPGCAPVDSWVIVDRGFAGLAGGQTLARITRRQANCPQRLGYAYTRWQVQPVGFRTRLRGVPGRAVLPTLVSEHFGGQNATGADHLERMYFTRELGYTRWERWQNLSVHDRARDRQLAAALAGSDRCAPGLGAPGLNASAASGWIMIDCREWTQIVPPADPAGDPPRFWVDRLRGYEATRMLFGP